MFRDISAGNVSKEGHVYVCGRVKAKANSMTGRLFVI